ncbi:MAG TPA: type VI secretion system baseplate subunit TssF [Bryobacteraceae bacterium]|nr:type VI secretion system baseplate subunit TssF [Bryobacteraceae bacterium]
MRDDFLLYYQRELTFLRQMGVEFADKYPKIAQRLFLEADKCDDPHVERIIESFAFLAARVHLKIDDEFPEITEALLSIVYPHYIRPIPSMSVVEMVLDPERGKLTSGLKIARNTTMYSKSVSGDPCKFRTCYDTTLWPVHVAEANYLPPDRLSPPIKSSEAIGSLRLLMQTAQDVQFDKLEMSSLRFYLHGESKLVHTIYELLMNNCVQVQIRDPQNTRRKAITLPATSIRALGFTEEEGMLPYPRRSFLAYRLLQEYFTFPEKFFFLELTDLSAVWAQGFKEQAEIVFLISPFEIEDRRQELELGISPKTFRLGCTPIINLFPQTCEPILLDQRKHEYPVVPDVRRLTSTEVFSIEEVVSIDPQTREMKTFEPFYSYRHAAIRDNKQTFWVSNRRLSQQRNDEGTDIFLSLVDLSMRTVHPTADTLTIRTLCTNRDLPARLSFGNEAGDFTIEGMAALKKIVCLRRPSGTLRPPLGKGIFWRLISHFSINYLSLVEEGREALQEILKLYNFNDSVYTAKMVDGITRLKSRRQFARVISENGISFARGIHTEIEFDEEQFVGGGVYLFASVLEYFLGLYATLNSFSQLAVRTKQRKEVVREWLPRAGQRILM